MGARGYNNWTALLGPDVAVTPRPLWLHLDLDEPLPPCPRFEAIRPKRQAAPAFAWLVSLLVISLVGFGGLYSQKQSPHLVSFTQPVPAIESLGQSAADIAATAVKAPAKKPPPVKAKQTQAKQAKPAFAIAFPKEAGQPLYDRPGGRVLVRLSAQTIFGTDRGLSVVSERGDWLGVAVEELKNGQLGWLPRTRAQIGTVRLKLVADLSRRELTLERDGEVELRVPVGVGADVSPTPIGRFAVSDELVQPYLGGSGEYGCCALVLTGHQYNLPPGWNGSGDRLAIHGTNRPRSIGQRASAGCLRASDDDLQKLLGLVPVGTPLVIHP